MFQRTTPGEQGKRLSRRWRTTSLRGLMLLIALSALCLAWQANRVRTQQRAIQIIKDAGGWVHYDDEIDDEGYGRQAVFTRPSWQKWLMRNLGDDYIRKPRSVFFGTPSLMGIRTLDHPLRPETWNAIGDLPDLLQILVQSPYTNDADLSQLRRLRNLRYLNLAHSPEVTDAGLTHIRGMQHLWSLDLSETSLSDSGMRYLNDKSNMKQLGLEGTKISDAGLVHLRGMQKLSVLRLNDNHLTDAGMEHLTGLKRLEILRLRNTLIGDAGLALLCKLTRLDSLNLAGTRVSDVSIDYLKQLPRLDSVELTGTRVTPEGAQKLKPVNQRLSFPPWRAP